MDFGYEERERERKGTKEDEERENPFVGFAVIEREVG